MKHTILIIAFASTAAHAAPVVVPVRVTLPGVRVPTVAITPKIGLPTPVVPVVTPKPVLANLPQAPIVLPGAFNPNSPIVLPGALNGDNTGKISAQLSNLFDNAGKKEAPAVPAEEKAELPKDSPVQPGATIRAGKGNSQITLPESDLIREIGF